MKDVDLFFNFLLEYIDFYAQIESQSRERLEVLTGYSLAGLEQSIANDQSAIMRAEQMEKRRIELQQAAGYGTLSLREIIDTAEGDDKKELDRIYSKLNELLGNIRFYNARCSKVIEKNIYRIEKATTTQAKQAEVPGQQELQSIRLDGKA